MLVQAAPLSLLCLLLPKPSAPPHYLQLAAGNSTQILLGMMCRQNCLFLLCPPLLKASLFTLCSQQHIPVRMRA